MKMLGRDLVERFAEVNRSRLMGLETAEESLSDPVLAGVEERLACYGTLRPGGCNHGVVEGFGGLWRPGVVRGRFYDAGWGAAVGAPGLVWDEAAEEVSIDLLESARLEAAWPVLDRFEGDEYVRLVVPVTLEGGVVAANLYALRAETARLATG